MINSEVILAGCRAYVRANSHSEVSEDQVERHAVGLANGRTVDGRMWGLITGPLLAALTAAVDADRHMPVTAQPL